MSSNHGLLNRDLIGGSLQIGGGRITLDKFNNLCVRDALIKGDLTVKGNINQVTQSGNIESLQTQLDAQAAQITALMGRAETTFADLPAAETIVGATEFNKTLQLTSTDTPTFMTWGPELNPITGNLSQTGNITEPGTYCVGFSYTTITQGMGQEVFDISTSIRVIPSVGPEQRVLKQDNLINGEFTSRSGVLILKSVLDEENIPATLGFLVGKQPTPSVDVTITNTYAWVTKLA